VECHREIAESYARTAMARTFGAVRSEHEFPELKGGGFQHTASEEIFTMSARDGKPYLKRHQIGFDAQSSIPRGFLTTGRWKSACNATWKPPA